jgi:superfamily II DNA/RNA helicase
MKEKAQRQSGSHSSKLDPLQQTLKSDPAEEKRIIEKFRKEGFDSLTPIQRKALPVIARRVNCILVAPTGSG